MTALEVLGYVYRTGSTLAADGQGGLILKARPQYQVEPLLLGIKIHKPQLLAFLASRKEATWPESWMA